ncbi:DUF4373 domain-containing protein [Paenibacillus sp. VCA1]|uniref:DUF4373 domain-containing protein n=1 Tax=unclassified Paenibacillus TaxID=185978 RepID=UPI0028718FA2|nr:DUF4373 domain-containing protein [Paenibacillus sp. VCA1]MDR9857845.1 DUF4373 domain-containing protein [Paenibacillus sp. VCA1]
MKEAYYFSHDSNARHDPKISAMRGVYGAEGYGWYWMIIEMMRDSDGYKLDMQSKYAFNAFALQLQADCSKIEEFVADCINEFHLFESDGKFFWSNSLIRRMAQREEVRAKRSAAAKARWDKEKSESGKASENAQPMQMHDQSNANAMQGKESKGKESKGNKKENKKMSPEPPSAVQDNHPPQKDNKDKYGPENTYYKMAVYFKNKIDEMAAREGLQHLTGKTNLQTWADDFRKLVELDKQSDKDLIRSVMDWVVNDDFWKSNVLSAEKFRKQFPRLVLAMKKKTNSSKVVPIGTSKKPQISMAAPSSEPEISDAEFEEMMRMAKEMSTNKGGRSHA